MRQITQNYIGLLILMLLIFNPLLIDAQDIAPHNSLSGYMRSDGKLWVVIAVITIILLGLIYYIRQIARRVAKIKTRI
jgi:hypothetical protein